MSKQAQELATITPSQTVGPYFAYCLTPRNYGGRELCNEVLATAEADGVRIRLVGTVYDGKGEIVPDALVEVWQADGSGRYVTQAYSAEAAFKGFGRFECDEQGEFRFDTVMPGSVPGPGGKPQAPHININVFAKGLLRQAFTRVYFADEPLNAEDPILALVPAERRHTLIARRVDDQTWRFDIRLQGGEDETVFFEV